MSLGVHAHLVLNEFHVFGISCRMLRDGGGRRGGGFLAKGTGFYLFVVEMEDVDDEADLG